jgi:hypothetical protein
MCSLFLFLVFMVLWKDKVIAFYSSFFVGLMVFFSGLCCMYKGSSLGQYLGARYVSASNNIIGEIDVVFRFLGLVVGLLFISFVFFMLSHSLNNKNN